MDRPESPESAGSGQIDLNMASPSSANIVARFEFETGRGNDGTKVLLVEWDCESDEPRAEECQVDWDGKTKVLPVADRRNGSSCRRLLFWLPPAATIPPTISIIRPGRPILHAKPLPAIFTPGLGSDVPDAGRRGVLHTLWATARIGVLQDEITREAHENTESVGLDMAIKEKEFIVDHFGLDSDIKGPATKPILPPLSTITLAGAVHLDARSPLSARMTEKLKGLRLATSPEELAAAASEPKSEPKPDPMAIIAGLPPTTSIASTIDTRKSHDDDDGELFALPMSPRSPEMKKSPFSLL